MIRATKPEHIATIITRLIASGGAWRVPLYRAAADGSIAVVENLRGTLVPWKVLRDSSRPHVILVGDDDALSSGPTGWPQAKRLIRWAGSIVVHGTGGEEWQYHTITAAALVMRRVLVIETSSRQVAPWHNLALEVAPTTPGLLLIPPDDGTHPNEQVPAGEQTH